MERVIYYLDKIYASGGTKLYIYIILAGVASILLLMFVYSMIKTKPKEEVSEEQVPEPVLEPAQNQVSEPVVDENVLPSEVLPTEPVKETTYSSVYLETKEEPVNLQNQEMNTDNLQNQEVINKDLYQNQVLNSESHAFDINYAPVENQVVEELPPIVNLSSDVGLPNLKHSAQIDEMRNKTEVVEIPVETTSEVEVAVEPDFNITFDPSYEETYQEPLVLPNLKEEPEMFTPVGDVKEELSEPLVLSPDDIRSKLSKLETNEEESTPNTLDDLLSQLGVDNSAPADNNDEESILLGK